MLTAESVYRMLGNQTLWDYSRRCHDLLTAACIPYSICGGVAVCLHGYRRNTIDLDIVVRPADSEAVSELLSRNGFQWDPLKTEFRTEDGIAVHFCIAGEPAGKGSEVRIPEPVGEQNVEEREGLRVVRLSRLIEMKIACGTGNLRRTHKDLADVVELIAIRKLDSSFARFLHPTLRPDFRTLVNNARASDG